MWGFCGVSHGFLSFCMHSSHFSKLSMSSCIKQAVHQADDLGIWHLCSNPCSFLFSYAPWDSFSVSLENQGQSTRCPARRSTASFPHCDDNFYTVLFNNSPRKHSQASGLSQKMAGVEIRSREPHFLTAPAVTPTLSDRDRNHSAAGSESIQGTPPELYLQQTKDRPTLLLFLGIVCGY